MSTSPQRIAANTRNSAHSCGPRTAAGKMRSCRNALKHGLTSKDVVLPNEDPAAYQERLDQWLDYYQPDDPAQLAVIERAVNAKWKLDRCTRLETERLSEKVRHAVDQYDLDRSSEAEALGQRLVYEPMDRTAVPQTHDPVWRARLEKRVADNPVILTKQLQMTSQGVQWLIDRWIELGQMLELHGYWHYPEKFKALYMLGLHPEDVVENQTVQRLFLACNIAHPDTAENDPEHFSLWDECFQTKMGIQGKPMYFFQTNVLLELRPKDHLTARAIMWDILKQELDRLHALKAYLDPIDQADRAGAEQRAMFDGSKEGVLIRRYESACEREFHKSIADLMKLRKEPIPECVADDDEAPLQNEPIAEASPEQALTSDTPSSAYPRTAPPADPEAADGPVTLSEVPAAPEMAPAAPR